MVSNCCKEIQKKLPRATNLYKFFNIFILAPLSLSNLYLKSTRAFWEQHCPRKWAGVLLHRYATLAKFFQSFKISSTPMHNSCVPIQLSACKMRITTSMYKFLMLNKCLMCFANSAKKSDWILLFADTRTRLGKRFPCEKF